jgi:hypothetical protein
VNAETPAISGHPQSTTVNLDASVSLSVSASVTDGGTLTYQWYSNANNSNSGGTAISGATNATYSPATNTIGTKYYCVVITNTNNSASGTKTASITSNAAGVIVTNIIVEPEKDSTLYGVTVNGRTLIVSDAMQYALSCGEDNATLKIHVSSKARIFLNGTEQDSVSTVPVTGAATDVKILIVAESGASSQEYNLTLIAPLSDALLYFQRWDDVLAINHNPKNNGGYTITGVRWYKNNELVSNKKFIRYDGNEYRAEVETNGVWHRLCSFVSTRAIKGIAAWPNPVSHGESLTLRLPESFVGGTLNIYTVAGSLVKSGITLPTALSNVRVDDLPAGIYLLKVATTKGHSETVKIVISD